MLNAIYGPPATVIIGSYALAKEEVAQAKEIALPEVEETVAPNVEEAVIEVNETDAAQIEESEDSEDAEDPVIVFIVDDAVQAQIEESDKTEETASVTLEKTLAAKVEEKVEEKALVTEGKANEIVQAFLRGLDTKNLSKAIALIKACQNDGTWQEVRALVNATLGLFFTVPVQDRLA